MKKALVIAALTLVSTQAFGNKLKDCDAKIGEQHASNLVISVTDKGENALIETTFEGREYLVEMESQEERDYVKNNVTYIAEACVVDLGNAQLLITDMVVRNADGTINK